MGCSELQLLPPCLYPQPRNYLFHNLPGLFAFTDFLQETSWLLNVASSGEPLLSFCLQLSGTGHRCQLSPLYLRVLEVSDLSQKLKISRQIRLLPCVLFSWCDFSGKATIFKALFTVSKSVLHPGSGNALENKLLML